MAVAVESPFLYSMNDVINIDNNSSRFNMVINKNLDTVYSNLEDQKITSQFRVVGGAWTDDLNVRNIFSHDDDQEGENHKLTIGCNVDDITVNSMNLNLATPDNAGSVTNIYGKTIQQGESDTNMQISMNTLAIGDETRGAYAHFDNSLNTMKLGATSTSQMDVNAQNLTMDVSTKLDVSTAFFEINGANEDAKLLVDAIAKTITMGGTTSEMVSVISKNIENNASVSILNNVPKYEIKTPDESVYFGLDQATSSIQIGTNNVTQNLTLSAINFQLETSDFSLVTPVYKVDATDVEIIGKDKLNLTSDLTTINSSSSNTFLGVDDVNSLITIGTSTTNNINVSSLNLDVTSTNVKFNSSVFEVYDDAESTLLSLNKNTNKVKVGSVGTTIIDVLGQNIGIDSAVNLTLAGGNTTTVSGDTLLTLVSSTNVVTDTPLFEVNTSNDYGYFKADKSGDIQIGGLGNLNTKINGATTLIKADTRLDINTAVLELNSEPEGGYLKVDNASGIFQIGSTTLGTTKEVNVKTDKVKMDVQNEYSIETDLFTINKDNLTTRLVLDNANNSMTLGGDNLSEMTIKGDNVFIGAPDKNITLYGNIISHASGSNIITNTVTTETSAFHVHNTGTSTAMTVIQDNSVGGEKDLALFITKENQDRAPFRIDGDGRVGMGLERTSNIGAWLHVNRHDPDNSLGRNDMLRIDDIDNDATPFIIKEDGRLGIGTEDPQYKVDICNDEGTAKGIAIRDALYLKTDQVNKLFYNIGGVKYQDVTKDTDASLGFELSWPLNTVMNDTDADTYVFRVSCKFHAACTGNSVASINFDALVMPKDDGGTFPGEISMSDIYQSRSKSFKKIDCTISRLDVNKVLLKVSWGYRRNLPDNAITRAYLDMEVFAHQSLGDLTITKHSSITGSGTLADV
jgi:hypothetical protein